MLAPPPCSGRRPELSSASPGIAHTRSLQVLMAQGRNGKTACSLWSWHSPQGLSSRSFCCCSGELTVGSSGHQAVCASRIDPQLFPAFEPFSPSSLKLWPPKPPTSANTGYACNTTHTFSSPRQKEWIRTEIHRSVLLPVYKCSNLGQVFPPAEPCHLVMPQFLLVNSLPSSWSQWNCQTAVETTILERMQQWSGHELSLWHCIQTWRSARWAAEKHQSRDITVLAVAAEQS